jgi:LuxR family maltose regulon positive regulatory protein
MTNLLQDSGTPDAWMWVGKLAPPHNRLEAVTRHALLDSLIQNEDKALTLAVSPPGFGKTTLFTQLRALLMQEGKGRVAWLSLDEADAETSRFLGYLLLSLETAGLDLGGLAHSARSQALERPPHRTLLALLKALAQDGRRFWVVLDDYHRSACRQIDEIIVTLLERGSQWLHLVVSSRNRPSWPLSDLNSRGLVFEISANDLVLSLAEAAEIFGPDVGESAVATVHSKTEGWAVAVQLARLWLARGSGSAFGLPSFSGRVAEVAGYLAEQIVNNLPADCREFLVETSLLESFNAELADAARGRDDSGQLLAQLRSFEALLIPLDANHSWFRYHLLLVDFLQPRLDTTRSRQIHRAAATWLAEREDWARAVAHALRANDTFLGTQLIQNAGGWRLVLKRGIFYTESLIGQFDDVTRRSDPGLLLAQAYLQAKRGNEALAIELLRLAEVMVKESPQLSVDFDVVRSLVSNYFERFAEPANWPVTWRSAADRAPGDHLAQATLLTVGAACSLAWGRFEDAITAARDARTRMQLVASPLGENYCLMHEALALAISGRVKASRGLIDEALALAEVNFGTESSLKAMVGCFKALHLYWEGRWSETEPQIRESEEVLGRTDGWFNAFAAVTETSWRTGFRRHGFRYATEVLNRAAQCARERNLQRLRLLVEVWRVDLLSQAGFAEQAQQQAAAARLDAIRQSPNELGMDWRIREGAALGLMRMHLLTGGANAALVHLEREINAFLRAGLLLPVWRLRLMFLVAAHRTGTHEITQREADDILSTILENGVSGLFLEIGPGALQIIQRANGLLSANFSAVVTQLRGWRAHPVRLHAGFTAKETQVLDSLTKGQSNKAIARALDVSENTVKFHLKQIFQKLGVDNRASAIAIALQQDVRTPDA